MLLFGIGFTVENDLFYYKADLQNDKNEKCNQVSKSKITTKVKCVNPHQEVKAKADYKSYGPDVAHSFPVIELSAIILLESCWST